MKSLGKPGLNIAALFASIVLLAGALLAGPDRVRGADPTVELAPTLLPLAPGATGSVDVLVKGFTSAGGLGAYDITITYDPAAVGITGVSGGDAPFVSLPVQNLTTPGHVVWNAIQTTPLPGPTGDIRIARLDLRAVGAAGAGSALSFTKAVLVNAATADPVTNTRVAGRVNITALPVNSPPVANPQVLVTSEDNPVAIVLTGTDLDGDPPTFAVASNPSNGALSGTPPHLTYTPNANFNGLDSFTYTASDGPNTSVPATVTITVTAVNDPPVAGDDTYAVDEDTGLNVPAPGVLVNDSDPEGNALTAALLTSVSHGALALSADGSFNYAPNANYSGPDSFTYTASDGVAASAPATITITVTAINDPPVANGQAVSTPEDTPVGVTLIGSDPDGGTLTFVVATGPASGILTGTSPNLTYTPNANFNGADSFTFTANDGVATSAPATSSITVTAVNDPPTANDQAVSTQKDTPVGVTLTGSDPDGGTPTFVVATGPASGTLSGISPNLTYAPSAGFVGVDSFTYTASDGVATSAPATVNITVNTPPTSDSQGLATPKGTPLAVTLTGSDPDGDTLTFFVVPPGPANGTLTGTAPNLTYTPKAGFVGDDSFTFTANDGTASSTPATVLITVSAVVAQLSMKYEIDPAGVVLLNACVDQFRRIDTGEQNVQLSGGVGRYQGEVTYDPIGIQVLAVRATTDFTTLPTVTPISPGRTLFKASQTGANPQAPLCVAGLVVQLVGPHTNAYNLTLGLTLVDGNGGLVPAAAPAVKTFRRGDANSDGILGVGDHLLVGQFLADLWELGDPEAALFNPVNAASVVRDAGGDIIDIADRLRIAQALVDIVNPFFQVP